MRFKKLIYLKSKPIFIGLLLFFNSYVAQVNLIPNPSFEVVNLPYTTCNDFTVVANWYKAFGNTAYLTSMSVNNCFGCMVGSPVDNSGYQVPHSGIAKVGLIIRSLFTNNGYTVFSNFSNLIGVKLTNQLQKNHVYDFGLYYSLVNGSTKISNQLSAYFTSSQFSINTNFDPLSQNWYNSNLNNIKPQVNYDSTKFLSEDTLNWQLFNRCFIADGIENYVTIGNFKDGIQSKTKQINTNFNFPCSNIPPFEGCLIYIDDLSLYDIGYYSGKAAAKKDTVICNGVSYTIGNNLKDSASITWWPSAGLSCTNCLNPVASPTVTTKYYVQKTLGCISSKDSITLSVYTPSTSAYAGKSATLCINDKLQLGTNDVNAYSTYTWQPTQYLNCYYCPQPMATAQSNITYTLSRQECSSASSSTIDIYIDNCELLLPQGFSPNNDGINDDLLINLPFTTEAKLTVFNRWGNILFEQSSTTQGTNVKYPLSLQLNWDGKAQKGIMIEKGKLVPAGTYFYLVEATHNDGSKKVYKEFVQVVY